MVDLNVINLGIKGKIKPCKISLCQIQCPSKFEKATLRFESPEDEEQKKKILNYLNSIPSDADVVIFPEFCTPEKTLPDLKEIAESKQIYIIGGMEYDHWLRNLCLVITPKGKCYRSAKLNPSKYEEEILSKCGKEMRRGEYINCFVNSGFGDFAVLICYDYTSQNLIQELSGKIDILFVIACNPDVNTFSQKALSDCYTNYCYIIICNDAKYGGSGVYGPLDEYLGKKVNKKIIELSKEEKIETIEVNAMNLRNAIEQKTGLNTGNGSRFKAIPASFKRKKLSPTKPQLEYTLLDWPEPFDKDCVIIIGSAKGRAIRDLPGENAKDWKEIMEINEKLYHEIKPYLPGEDKYYIAHPSDCAFLPQLTERLLSSPRKGIVPKVFEDEWVIEGEKVHPVLKEHNIISIGTAEVNKVSEKINEELKKDGHIYFVEQREPSNLYDESIGKKIWWRDVQKKAGIIALTRNPFNPNKLALLCGGIHGLGTAAAMKFLAENDGEAFRGHRYGVTVFAIDIDKPEGFSKGPVMTVLKIDDPELEKYLPEI